MAIKIIDKKENADALDLIKREIDVLRLLSHPNVVRLRETFEDTYTIEIVMDLIAGGELFEVIVEKGFFSEDDSAFLIRQILLGVLHCHQHKVVHRGTKSRETADPIFLTRAADLKPENLLCVNTEDGSLSRIVLCDFGVSAKLPEEGGKLTGRFGSADYISPEMHQDKEYSLATDMWSLGVIAYIILAGYPPFQPDNEEDDMTIARAVINDELQFPDEEWEIITPMAKDFIQKLLQKDPETRMTAPQALVHPFMSARFGEPASALMALGTPLASPRRSGSMEPLNAPRQMYSEKSQPSPRETDSASSVSSDGSLTAGTTPRLSQALGERKPFVITKIEVGGLAGGHNAPVVLTARSRSSQDAAAAKRAQNLKQFNAKRRFAGAKNLFKFFSNKIFGGDSASANGSAGTPPGTSTATKASFKLGSKTSSTNLSANVVSVASDQAGTPRSGHSNVINKSKRHSVQPQRSPSAVLPSSSTPHLKGGKISTAAAAVTTSGPATAPAQSSPPQSPHSPHSPHSTLSTSSTSSPKGSPRSSGSPRKASPENNSSPRSLAPSSSSPSLNVGKVSSSGSADGASGFALIKKRFESLGAPASSSSSGTGSGTKKKKSSPPDTRSTSPTRERSTTTVELGSIAFETRVSKRRSRVVTAEDVEAATTTGGSDAISAFDLPAKASLIRVHSMKEDRRRSEKKQRPASAKLAAPIADSSNSSPSPTSSSVPAATGDTLESVSEDLEPPPTPKHPPAVAMESPSAVSHVAAISPPESARSQASESPRSSSSSTAAEEPQRRMSEPAPDSIVPVATTSPVRARPQSTYDSFFGSLASLSLSDLPSFSVEPRKPAARPVSATVSAATPAATPAPTPVAPVPTSAPAPSATAEARPPAEKAAQVPMAKAPTLATRTRTRSGTLSAIVPAVAGAPVPSIEELRASSPPRRAESPPKAAPLRTKSSVKMLVGSFESLKTQDPAPAAQKSKKPVASSTIAAGEASPAPAPTPSEPAEEKSRKGPGSGLLRIMSVGIFNRGKKVDSSGGAKMASPAVAETPTPAQTTKPTDSKVDDSSSKASSKASLMARSKSTVNVAKDVITAFEPPKDLSNIQKPIAVASAFLTLFP